MHGSVLGSGGGVLPCHQESNVPSAGSRADASIRNVCSAGPDQGAVVARDRRQSIVTRHGGSFCSWGRGLLWAVISVRGTVPGGSRRGLCVCVCVNVGCVGLQISKGRGRGGFHAFMFGTSFRHFISPHFGALRLEPCKAENFRALGGETWFVLGS